MSAAEKRLPLARARVTAEHFQEVLGAGCERIEIVGSIRRNAPDVGDIELLAIPRYVPAPRPGDLFGADTVLENRLERQVTALIELGELATHPIDPKDGPKYKKLWSPLFGVSLDLFIVTPPAEWGPALAIRTGAAEFSKLLVTKLRFRQMRCEDLRVVRFSGESVPCPTEEEFFRLCGMPYLAPERRF